MGAGHLRRNLGMGGVSKIGLLAVTLLASFAAGQTKETFVYVGTYTGGKSKSEGIYLFRLQTKNLEVSQNITLVPLGLAVATPNPSFLVIDEQRRVFFAPHVIDTSATTT